jgi:hypothetical protein
MRERSLPVTGGKEALLNAQRKGVIIDTKTVENLRRGYQSAAEKINAALSQGMDKEHTELDRIAHRALEAHFTQRAKELLGLLITEEEGI